MYISAHPTQSNQSDWKRTQNPAHQTSKVCQPELVKSVCLSLRRGKVTGTGSIQDAKVCLCVQSHSACVKYSDHIITPADTFFSSVWPEGSRGTTRGVHTLLNSY